MRLELGIMAGAESKAFLADLTKVVERFEKAAGILGVKGKAKASADTEFEETDTDETDDEDEFTTTKKAGKKTAAFDEDAEDETDTDETEDEDEAPVAKKTKGKKAAAFDADEEEASEEEESEDETEEEEAPVAKKTKSKKITVDDVNDACKARIQRLIKKGQPGPEARKSVEKTLEKKFGSKSISGIDPKQYAKVIETLQA